jgi:putative peptide zinc metalloprotease protein
LIYRIVVVVAMSTWIATFSFSLAIGFIAWGAFGLLVRPSYVFMKFLLSSPVVKARSRAIAGAFVCSVFFAVVFGLIPVPHSTQSEGVVWVPEKSRLRAQADGFIQKVLVKDQAKVALGEAILLLDDPVLRSDCLRAKARLEALEANYQLALSKSSPDTGPLRDDIERVKSEVARFESRIELLTVRSEATGVIALSRASDLPGGYLAKGTLIGHVIEPGKTVVRAVLTQADVSLVQDKITHVEVRLAEQNLVMKPASILNQTPASTRELPSAALSEKGGGAFATDPSDENGLALQTPVFVLDVQLDQEPLRRIGGRAWVRFDHGAQPLAMQWARGLRQVFLKHLGNDSV